MEPSFSLFQEPWWLRAVTGGQYKEATVKQGELVVGRLPFAMARRGPFRLSLMPAFTHLLGPAVNVGAGKPQTQLMRRLSITRDLIDQLPSFAFFKQVFDPALSDGLAIADGLAFQDRNFRVSTQYTFQIDTKRHPDSIWEGMHFKVRQHIRRAEERYCVKTVDDPDRFVHFYAENLKKLHRPNRANFGVFPDLFLETQTRQCGTIQEASTADGTPVAMTYLVWGHGVMYYLLSTRAPDMNDNGSVSLLLWSAIKQAHQLGLRFDFDGIYSSGSARFLSGFGGQIGVRLIATRAGPFYGALQSFKGRVSHNPSEGFA